MGKAKAQAVVETTPPPAEVPESPGAVETVPAQDSTEVTPPTGVDLAQALAQAMDEAPRAESVPRPMMTAQTYDPADVSNVVYPDRDFMDMAAPVMRVEPVSDPQITSLWREGGGDPYPMFSGPVRDTVKA